MTLRDDFAADILDGFRDLAEPAVYRPKSGANPIDTYALIESYQIEVETRARGEFASIRIPITDIPHPAIDDIIVINEEEWQVRPSTDQQIERYRKYPFWILRCRRHVLLTLGGRS